MSIVDLKIVSGRNSLEIASKEDGAYAMQLNMYAHMASDQVKVKKLHLLVINEESYSSSDEVIKEIAIKHLVN